MMADNLSFYNIMGYRLVYTMMLFTAKMQTSTQLENV